MKKTCVVLALCGLLIPAAAVAENLFLETFEDGNLFDGSPLTWGVFPGFDVGKTSVVDGDLVVSQTGGRSFVPFAQAVAPANVSLKTALRTEDFMTVIARGNTQTGTSYGGGIRSNGDVYIERTHPGSGSGVSTFLANQASELRPAEEDVYLQFDLFGSELSLFAWRVGEDKPSEPSVHVSDGTHSNPGIFGFIKCCGTESSTVQFLQVSNTPISGILGDFNSNELIDAGDIDLLGTAIESHDAIFDLNFDGFVDSGDHTLWVEQIAQTLPGDANLSRQVDFEDFLILAENFGQEGGWSVGNFDGLDGVDFPDFLLLSKNFGAVKSETVSVPEPSNALLASLSAFSVAILLRRNSSTAIADAAAEM